MTGDDEDTFVYEHNRIYIVVRDGNGDRIDRALIGHATGEGFAHTLTRCANVGYREIQRCVIDTHTDRLLQDLADGERGDLS